MASSTATADPQAEAQAALAVTPTRELLRKAYSLTHKMHGQRTDHAELRAMRDLIDAEIERRTGDLL